VVIVPTTSSHITVAPTSTTPLAPVLFGGQTISVNSNSEFLFGSQTLTPGQVITVSGQQISAGTGGALIINAATPNPSTSTTPPAVVVIDGVSITANSNSGFVIGTQTLFPGGVITESGRVITLPSASPTVTSAVNTQPVVIVGSSTFTQDSQSDFVIGSQTLKPGGVITVSGQAISLSPTGNAVIINGNTQTTPTTFATTTVVTSVDIAGQTLTAGGRVTVGGDVLSLAPSGTGIIVIGTVTVGVGESASTGTSGKKNAGQRTTSGSYSTLLQISFVLLAFWFG
jgi:hypothetical protein